MSTKEAMRRAEKASRARRRERGVERLSVDISPETAAQLKRAMAEFECTKTEAVRLAFDYLREEMDKRDRLSGEDE